MNPMPAAADHSDENAGIQWPLSQPWPAAHPPLRLGVMASGHGSNFEALVASGRHGDLNASVELLVVNQPGCGSIERAERLGISWRLLDHRRFSSREALDGALIEVFGQAQVDLVVMAGWMRIVTPVLIEAFPQRLVNIHPSLLPSFRGVDAIGQALAAGVTLAGCSAHLVTAEVDGGPILAQAAVPVCPGDDHARLAARIQQQEHRILPLAVALAAERLAQASSARPAQAQG
jgi:phosphoribosylglycinamide formyltransferase 1